MSTWAITEGAKFIKRKTGIEVSNDIKQKGVDAARDAIAKAEEWGRKTYIVDPADSTKQLKPTGEMKMQVAIHTAASFHPPFAEMAQKEPQKLEDIIDAQLAKMRPVLSLNAPASSSSMRPVAAEDGLNGETVVSSVPKAAPIPVEFRSHMDDKR